ncbi:MAG: hypothetical protein KDA62_16115, partial [Planctomycetales bacterium]|nr:hypothetical protein [Planctomycetales bacterium]
FGPRICGQSPAVAVTFAIEKQTATNAATIETQSRPYWRTDDSLYWRGMTVRFGLLPELIEPSGI